MKQYCLYIYIYIFFHIFNVCIHRARIQVILLKFWVLCLHMLGKDLNSAIIAAMVKRFSNLLHPTNGCKHTFTWDTSVVVSQCVVCCCKMDLTWVKNDQDLCSTKTPGVVKNHLNLIEKTVAIGGPHPPHHPPRNNQSLLRPPLVCKGQAAGGQV